MGKGPGKGNQKGSAPKGGKGKDGKGKFQGNCLCCGIWGHRLNECHKKTADMEKGKGKGMEPGWTPPAYKGKGKEQKGKGKGAWGKGGKGKGMYYMEDDWSAGQSGYSFDVPMFLATPAPAIPGDWKVDRPKKPAKAPPNYEVAPVPVQDYAHWCVHRVSVPHQQGTVRSPIGLRLGT